MSKPKADRPAITTLTTGPHRGTWMDLADKGGKVVGQAAAVEQDGHHRYAAFYHEDFGGDRGLPAIAVFIHHETGTPWVQVAVKDGTMLPVYMSLRDVVDHVRAEGVDTVMTPGEQDASTCPHCNCPHPPQQAE